MPHVIQVPILLTDQMAADIMCTALEGGIGYWCAAGNIQRTEPDKDERWNYVSFEANPAEDDDDFKPQVVTYATIAEGIRKILACDPKPHVNDYLRSMIGSVAKGEDDYDIDADGADAIIQVGLFGELVYG